MKNTFFVLIACIFLSSNLFSTSLELQGIYNKKKIGFLIKKNSLHQVDRINCVKLDESLRPSIWKDRIPFGIGIDNSQNKLYFLYYESFFRKYIIPIENEDFIKLEDVCVNEQGLICIADSKKNAVFYYQFDKDLKTAKLLGVFSVDKPFRCEFFGKNKILVITKNNDIICLENNNNKFTRIKNFALKIEKYLKEQKLVDISVSDYKQKNIFILTDNSVYKFNSLGQLVISKKLNTEYSGIENSYFGDVFILNSNQNYIIKYNPKLELLCKVILPKSMKDNDKDLTVYDSFGYLIVSAKTEGAYYGMGVDIKFCDILKNTSISGDDFYNIKFLVSFPSLITIRIKDNKGNISHILIKNKKMLSGTHSILWDGLDSSNRKLSGSFTIEISAKGRYSLANRAMCYKKIIL